jgi:hypothetical protein
MKPIAYYENRYLIGEDGSILNLANNTRLTPSENPNGYLKVSLANGDGTSTQQSIHRLVALHYVPNPYGYTQVNHKDGNKKHNQDTNLEWCDPSYNINHAFKTGLRKGYMSADDKEHHLHQVLNGAQVNDIAVQISRRPETLHKMLRETSKRLGIHDQWQAVMKENRKNAAIRNLTKVNS